MVERKNPRLRRQWNDGHGALGDRTKSALTFGVEERDVRPAHDEPASGLQHVAVGEQGRPGSRNEQVHLVFRPHNIEADRRQRGGGGAHDGLGDTSDHAAMEDAVLLADLRAVVDPEHDLAGIDPGRRDPDELKIALSRDVSLDEGAKIRIPRLKMGQHESFSNNVTEGNGTVPF